MSGSHRFDPEQMICTEDDGACAELRATMDAFYARTTDYTAFHKVTHKPDIWNPIVARIEALLGEERQVCRVMEFGAGMTGFPAFLSEKTRSSVDFVAQDVTAQNKEHLDEVADSVLIGDVREAQGPFDVIFSSFVWEHVTNPRATLGVLLERLAPGGSLFLACPRYDTFGYTPATAKHYPRADRMKLAFWLRSRRVRARKEGKPAFLIHNDPAMLHTDWFRDADAIHWVSRDDLGMALPSGFTIRDVEPQPKRKGLRGFIYNRFMLLFVEIRAPKA